MLPARFCPLSTRAFCWAMVATMVSGRMEKLASAARLT